MQQLTQCDLSSVPWKRLNLLQFSPEVQESGDREEIQEMKRKRPTLSCSSVLSESSAFISPFVIGSQVLLFGIDPKWNEIQPKQSFDYTGT